MNQQMLRPTDENFPGINSSEVGNLDKYYKTRHASMSLPDKLLLDPLDKYEQHNRFPWKMVIHIIIVCITTALVILLITDVADYRRNLEIMWSQLFLVDDGSYESLDPSKSLFLYNADSVANFVNTSVSNYYGVNDLTLEDFSLPTYPNGTIQAPVVRVTPLSFRDYQQPLIFEIDLENQYPFSKSSTLKKFVNQISSFTISYAFQTRLQSDAITNYNCFKWSIVQNLYFGSRGFIEATLNQDTAECGSSVQKVWRLYDWLHVLLILFAILSLSLSLRYIYKFSVMYKSIKKKYQRARKNKQIEYQEKMERIQEKNERLRFKKMSSRRKTLASPKSSVKLELKSSTPIVIEEEDSSELQNKESNRTKQGAFSVLSQGSVLRRKTTVKTLSDHNNEQRNESPDVKLKDLEDDRLIRWEDLQFSDKAALFNKWTIIAIIASFIQILSSFISLAQLDPHIIEYEILIGLGCMLAWINITRYIEYNRESAIFINTLGRSLPYVGRFLLGVFPIFLGYVFLGLAMFWNSKRFTSTSGAMITLFAVLNGDMVYDTFHDLGFVNIVLSQIYMYTFILLFINVVQNVFITIIEDGFISIKYKAEHEQFTKVPSTDEPDFRQINDENQKTGNVVMGATGSYFQHHHSHHHNTISFGQSERISSNIPAASSLLDIEQSRQKKKEKKKKLEYKSKVALYNIISDGKGRAFEAGQTEGNLAQWKIGLRTGHTAQRALQSRTITDEDSKHTDNQSDSFDLSEKKDQQIANIQKFGDSIVRQIQKADEKIEENTTVFDTEIREEFTKQLERIIEAAKKSSKEKL